ncbi:MAG: Asp-tRNA(Asn)/Glu-tRNA(Gln) amidotransferase subunit GatB [Bdellovibrionales bacterium]|nr:Asp-tRNA(Asn)/Glu-tRNA(Gln) amidotransferase subunit GatB [Bdellovibrionales bacterium]
MSLTAKDFEVVIGLEVHAQLATDTKCFCSTRSRMPEGKSVGEEAVNVNTCPVCTGHPGTLPVLSKKAVEYAVRAGLSIGCTINSKSIFARKNYFYPDLPKGYQISQFDKPLCENGFVDIETKGLGQKRVRVQRIHMEEDAGKNLHMSGFSLVNFNRSSVPLIEIVSHPDMRSAEEAVEYLKALHAIDTTTGVCDGNMQEGNFRCDANVSVKPKGQKEFGTRAEIKNVNSFRFVEKAIEHEVDRQVELILGGGKVVQETRLYDSDTNSTRSMRSKEEAHDYRYFPDPDLPPLVIDQKWVEEIRSKLPELPAQKRARYVADYGLSAYDAGVLTGSGSLAGFFEQVLSAMEKKGKKKTDVAKGAANLLTGEVARLTNEAGIEVTESKLTPAHLADTLELQLSGGISSTNAKLVITTAWENGDSAAKIVDARGLRQVSDKGALEAVVAQVIAANAGQWAEFTGGKDKLLGFFVGQCMKASKGQGNPALFTEIINTKKSQG